MNANEVFVTCWDDSIKPSVLNRARFKGNFCGQAPLVRNEIAGEKGFPERKGNGIHKEVRSGRKHNPGGILELESSARGECPGSSQ